MNFDSKEVYKVAIYNFHDDRIEVDLINSLENIHKRIYNITDLDMLYNYIENDAFDVILVNTNSLFNKDLKKYLNNYEDKIYYIDENNYDDLDVGNELLIKLYKSKQKRNRSIMKNILNKIENRVIDSELDNDTKIDTIIKEYLDIVKQKDEVTYTHIINVCNYVDIFLDGLPDEYKLNEQEIIFLKRCALLHDIGKLTIINKILKKTSKLTNAEYEAIKEHVSLDSYLFGSELMQPFKKIVLCHHLRYDGGDKSYPLEYRNLKGEGIPYFSRILFVIDTFEAMTGNRNYIYPKTLEQVLDIIEQEKGKQFDPIIASYFINGVKRHSELENTLYTLKDRTK